MNRGKMDRRPSRGTYLATSPIGSDRSRLRQGIDILVDGITNVFEVEVHRLRLGQHRVKPFLYSEYSERQADPENRQDDKKHAQHDTKNSQAFHDQHSPDWLITRSAYAVRMGVDGFARERGDRV